MTTSTPTHPADSIADATNFVDAVTRYIAGCNHELELTQNEDNRAGWFERIVQAEAVLWIVSRNSQSQAFHDLKVRNLNEFADAFISGDYSKLAF